MAEKLVLDDFSGGVQYGEDPAEFSERQWRALDGLVFEDERRLRTQWGVSELRGADADAAHLADVDGHLILVRDGEVVEASIPDLGSTSAPVWSQVFSFTGPTPRPVSKVPFRVASEGGWREGLLLNTVDKDQGSAWVLYVDSNGDVQFEELTNRYPNDESDAMPHGEVATMWGDFLVLGDVRWLDDDSSALSEANSIRHQHALWYSGPSAIDEWDPIDVEFAGNRRGDGGVVGLFPIDVGLIVVTQDGVHLLRGGPNDHVPEVIRNDIGCPHPGAVTYWPHTNAVVWADHDGHVWHTNGDEALPLDEALPPPSGSGEVALSAWLNHLAVRRGDDLWALRAFHRGGAWTRIVDESPAQLREAGGAFHFLADDGSVRRFDPQLDRDATLTPKMVTRTLGEPHRRTFWHRAGIRYRGAGDATELRWNVNRDEATFTEPLQLVDGGFAVIGAPGPSREAAVEVDLQGDVTVESVTLWFHESRSER